MGFKADELLYHYTTREAALNFILPTRRIRFSLMRHMNDPREAKKWIIFPDRDVEVPGYPQTEKEMFAFSDRVSGLMQSTTKILSLTRDAPADDRFYVFARGWSHSRMWTHYGGHQTGVCLVFNAQALARAIRVALSGRGDLWHEPVTYADEALEESRAFRIDYSRIAKIGFEAAVSEHIRLHHELLFFRKNTDWASEWEYRWVFRSPEPAPVFVPIGTALRRVIRGDAFPDSDLDSYRHLLADYPQASEGLFRWMNGGPFLVAGAGSGGLHARVKI